MAISGKLQDLIIIKQDIKLAIENKGVDLTGVVFDGYASKIDDIETGGGALPKLETPVISYASDGGSIEWLPVPNATMYKVYYGSSTPTKASPFVPTRLLYVSAGGIYENTYYIFDSEYVAVSAVAEGFLESDLSPANYIYRCFVEGTSITLANRTTKNVEDITYDDNLLVWDFDSGEFTSAKPLWILKSKTANKYTKLTFDDGTILSLVGEENKAHRVFDYDKGYFEYGNHLSIGARTFNDKGELITLINKETICEEVEYYNIITDYHMNLFANTVLTSCGYNNIYPIENMKFVKDERELIPIEDYNVDSKWYIGLRLGEQDLSLRSIKKAHTYIANLMEGEK